MPEVVTRTRKEVLKLWVEALESGKYEQVSSVLRKKTDGQYAYCCLGVLCQLAENDGGQAYNDSDEYANTIDFPPPKMMDFVFDLEFCESLAEMNDSGHTFKEIAKVIRDRMHEEGVGIA